MATRAFVFSLIVLCGILFVCDTISIPGYYNWSYGTRENLFCPYSCKTDETPDQCCSCEGKRCWELNKTLCPIGKLSVEYLDIFGTGEIVGSTNNSYVELIHTHGSLTKFPDNLCTFDKQLVILDLCRNRLSDVKNVDCLIKLDTLRLDFNMIRYIDNTTFTKMKDLRVLTMSHNLLQKLDPNVVIIEGGNIAIVDISDNHYMDILDLSNMIRPGPFCTINFTNSYIEHLTNEIGFVMADVIHGPGDILMEHTHLGSFINFTSLGLESMNDFFKYVQGSIRLDSSSVDCDCTLFPLLSSMGQEFGKYWKNVDGENFVCNSPESMKGRNLTNIIETGHFEGLTCDISEKPDCPHYRCHCMDMPSQHKVLVNCTGVGFTSMPEEMPVGAWNNYKIDLILVDNKISVLAGRKYYSRLVSLDLRLNNITIYTEEAARNISSYVNIGNQMLETIPAIIQHKDPNLITFGHHPIVCDCSNTWVGDWIRLKNGQGRLKCLVNGEVIPAEDVYDFTLNCDNQILWTRIVSSLTGAIAVIVLTTGIYFRLHNEIMILKRALFRSNFIEDVHTIDVFLSFYEDNEDIYRMVSRYIKPALLETGYTVFIPWDDIPYGIARDDEVAIAVGRSLNYVIVLCDNYTEDYNTNFALEIIWNSFQADKAKQIIMINYDDIDSSAIKDDRLRAVRRTRCLDFATRNSRLISRLKYKLGKPISRLQPKKRGNTYFGNKAFLKDIEDVEDEVQVTDNIIHPTGVNINDRTMSVFDRLAKHKVAQCNCKYRKCYLHDETLIHRPYKPAITSS